MGRNNRDYRRNRQDRYTYTEERGRHPETYDRRPPSAYAALMDSRATDSYKQQLDEYQTAYYRAMKKKKVVAVDRPAGTGKTTIAWIAAIEALRTGKASRILYVRFPSKRTERLGARPGTLEEKEAAYFLPAYDALAECGLQPEGIDQLKQRGIIKFLTDAMLRGTNLANCFVIIDECQNAEDLAQLQLVLTRLHDDSIAVLIGHSGQIDGKVTLYHGLNAFQVYVKHLTKKKWAVECDLRHNYRGEVSTWSDSVGETLQELENGSTEERL